jgi:hypothetical protein
MALTITSLCHYVECHYAACHILFVVVLTFIVLGAMMLSVLAYVLMPLTQSLSLHLLPSNKGKNEFLHLLVPLPQALRLNYIS